MSETLNTNENSNCANDKGYAGGFYGFKNDNYGLQKID